MAAAGKELEEALAKGFGSPLDLGHLPDDVRFLFEHPQRIAEEALEAAFTQETYTETKPYRLLAGFYRSSLPNAGTRDLDEGTSVVALSTGLASTLFQAFGVVVQRMDVSTCLPACDEEGRLVVAARRKRIAAGARTGAHEDQLTTLRQQVTGLSRRGHLPVALLLYDLAMRFVVMHECMHIVLGHTGYVRRVLRVESLMELGSSRRRLLAAADSQALEFIADRHAVRGVAHWARTGRLGDYVEALPRDSSVSQELYLQRALILALVTLLRLFPNRPTAEASALDSHPHPYTRLRWLCRELGEDQESRGDYVRAVLEPAAYWNASFERNFLAPGRWTEAINEDQDVGPDEEPLADRAYRSASARARHLQGTLWRSYGPLYAGDGR